MLELDEVASDMFKLHIVKVAMTDVFREVLPPDSGNLPHAHLPEVSSHGGVGGTSYGSITRKLQKNRETYCFSLFVERYNFESLLFKSVLLHCILFSLLSVKRKNKPAIFSSLAEISC